MPNGSLWVRYFGFQNVGNRIREALRFRVVHICLRRTGRYTFHFGYYDNIDASGPEGGVMLNYTLTPGDMKRAGYSTHGAGKWCVYLDTYLSSKWLHSDSRNRVVVSVG